MDGRGTLLQAQIEKGLDRAFDLRCLSLPPNERDSWFEMTERAIAALKIAKGDRRRPLYLCAESFGGCLALNVLLAAGDLVDRAVLINPASAFDRRSWIQWGSHLSGWIPAPLYPLSAIALLPFLASLGRLSRPESQALLAAMQSLPQETSSWRIGLLRDFAIAPEQLRQIQVPVAIVASGADRLLASIAESERLLTHLGNARRVILPESGHACLLETEVNLYQLLGDLDFLPPAAIALTPGCDRH
ncbi:alpha/beta fold hydrolase [Oxynema aestuarii AP17]|uniref:Alpha/beta fold hydrolase n=2 Tax=Oxynema TaxID=1492710 RepID=A0A6H1U3V3_9CYAN|nr:alpha/beta fold hydrolase [Oxynema aestuarii AP17]